MHTVRWLLLILIAGGCSEDGMPDGAPPTLRETGLYSDPENEVLAPDVVEFQPEYALWSDGATKKRWILLPDGEQIDTSDMDFWSYPIGTRLWKEFTRDGTRVETRLLWKRGPGARDWIMMAYAWDAEQSEAVAAPEGVTDALGTDHDIPEEKACRRCHIRMPDIVLGFTAFQLDHDLGGPNIESLVADGRLSRPPPGSAPFFDVPGRSQAERDAFGYLHANCGGCHHEDSDVMDETDVNLRLHAAEVGAPATETAIYTTTVDVPNQIDFPPATARVVPGDPATSALRLRMESRGSDPDDMPPVGTELVDGEGLAAIDAWINSL